VTDKVVGRKTGAGDGEFLVQAAHSLEAGETRAMALADGDSSTEAVQVEPEGHRKLRQSGIVPGRFFLAQNLAGYPGVSAASG
jgi:hypothetical protein